MTKTVSIDENYGFKDCSYKAAGEFEGIQRLVKTFYEFMDQLPEARTIRSMHAEDLSLIDDKLTHFLCYWLGGPRSFVNKHGTVSIPRAHQHLSIGYEERDAWLMCMEKALNRPEQGSRRSDAAGS